MFKKLLIIIIALSFLAGCGGQKEEKPKIDFKGPTSGPDLTKLRPERGPNDPVPTKVSVEAPLETQ